MRKILLALTLMITPLGAAAQAAQEPGRQTILPAGQSAWLPDLDTTQPLTIRVDLRSQMLYVMRGDQLIGLSNVSSGRPGYETPQGTFPIRGKEVDHWSVHYKASMPWTQWLTSTGVALHSGGLPGRPSSHGCVHLPRAFAARLFTMTHVGDVVVVEMGRAPLVLDLSDLAPEAQ